MGGGAGGGSSTATGGGVSGTGGGTSAAGGGVTGTGGGATTGSGGGTTTGTGGGTTPGNCVPYLSTDQALTADVPVFPITLDLSLPGSARPLTDYPYWNITFTGPGLTGSARIVTRTNGSVGAQAWLPAGTYELNFTIGELVLPLATNVVISGARTLQYALPVAALSGTVTVGGAAFAPVTGLGSRGKLIFKGTRGEQTFTIPASGTASYAGALLTGQYAVRFVPAGAQPALGVADLGTLDLSTDTTRNFDLKVITVTGTVRVNGATAPASPAASRRGDVTFRSVTDPISHGGYGSVPNTGAATYSAQLLAGSYSIGFDVEDGTVVGLPRNAWYPVTASRALTANTTVDLDLPVVTVTSTLTANGAAVPDSPGRTNRGALLWKANGSELKLLLPATGAATIASPMFPGTYEVSWSSNAVAAQTSPLVGLPGNGYTQLASVTVAAAPLTRTFDVQVVNTSIELTNQGAMLPQVSASSRGSVLAGYWGPAWAALVMPATGASRATGVVFAGTHDITFRPSTGAASSEMGVPDREVRLGDNVTVGASHAFDLHARQVSGRVTVNGTPLIPEFNDRMTLYSLDAEHSLAVPLDGGTFSGPMFEGRYEAIIEGGNQWPGRGLLAPAQVTASGTLEIATRTSMLSVIVTGAGLLGAGFRTSVEALDNITLERFPIEAAAEPTRLVAERSLPFGSYRVSLVVNYPQNDGFFIVTLKEPCADQPCTRTPSAPEGKWSLFFGVTVSHMQWNLSQQGATVTGEQLYWSYYNAAPTPFSAQWASPNLTVPSFFCASGGPVVAKLEQGCVLRGTFQGCGARPYAFTAIAR